MLQPIRSDAAPTFETTGAAPAVSAQRDAVSRRLVRPREPLAAGRPHRAGFLFGTEQPIL
jgi:hypothetical protein